MDKELQNFQIARFALNARFEQLGTENVDQLKKHLLDAIGSMLHSTNQPVPLKLMRQIQRLGTGGNCLVPSMGPLPADRAAQWMTALIRYPDFMDNFMAKEATCHPSDNIGPLLAAAQLHPTGGREFLTAMAVAYQLECRLVQEIPVMKEGIDHTLMLGYSLVGGLSRLLGMGEEQTAHALGMAGTTISPMVTSRASYTSQWKGLASSMVVNTVMQICFLAMEGTTGPLAIFEGPKGFEEVFKMKLRYDWSKETFELIPKCVLKEFNAEVHSQSVLEGVCDIRNAKSFEPGAIERIDVTTFLTAYHIIGGGAYGDRKTVHSKEQADHSLPYAVAVALLDGEIYPEQFAPGRIRSDDVQALLRKVFVRTGVPFHQPVVAAGLLDPYTQSYPDLVKARIVVRLQDGRTFTVEKKDYYGFFTRPLSWDDTIKKFKRLSAETTDGARQEQIIEVVRDLDNRPVKELIKLISQRP